MQRGKKYYNFIKGRLGMRGADCSSNGYVG